MKSNINRIFLALLLPALWFLDFDPSATLVVGIMPPAEAVVGRPATPVSVAGVARRSTRRAVVYSSTAAASASQQQAAAQQQQAAPPPQQAAPALPAGTIVTALPTGCVSTVVDGVSLFNCNGVIYQPTFQSNNLVYVVK
jgi:hypothetical protein